MDNNEIINIQTNWHSKGAQGCLYAAYLSKRNPLEAGFKRICLDGDLSLDLLASISQKFEESIADENNCILSIILPSLNRPKDLIGFVDFCKNHTNWIIEEREIPENHRQVKISVPTRFFCTNQEDVFLWMLGFAPFKFLPVTRQSPFFEIMIPTKSKEFFKNKFDRITLTRQGIESKDRGGEASDSHVADIFLKDITNNSAIDDLFWEKSTQRKFNLLTNFGNNVYHDVNAKAKVTFSYPISHEK